MRTVLISVTAEDIAKHGPRAADPEISRCCSCPVAVAMTRGLGRQVEVNGDEWHYLVDGWPSRPLPNFVAVLISTIDGGNYPPPFQFEVEAP